MVAPAAPRPRREARARSLAVRRGRFGKQTIHRRERDFIGCGYSQAGDQASKSPAETQPVKSVQSTRTARALLAARAAVRAAVPSVAAVAAPQKTAAAASSGAR
jgi:hypothetical protein